MSILDFVGERIDELKRGSPPQEEATLEISFPKALLVSIIAMACFIAAIYLLGIPRNDPMLNCFLIFMGSVMPFVFAGCICFMLRCKIGRDGLRPLLPTFYQIVFRWEDILSVWGSFPFYTVRCRTFGAQFLLPCPFLLKRPENMREFIDQYAPPENVIRKKLSA